MKVSRQSLIVLGFGLFAILVLFASLFQKNSPTAEPTAKKMYTVADFLKRATSKKNSSAPPAAEQSVSATPAATTGPSPSVSADEEEDTNLNPKFPMGDIELLRRLTTDNDVCTLRKYNFKVADILTVIMDAPDSIQVDSEKDRTMSELFSAPATSGTNVSVQNTERSKLGSFWTALALSGQLDFVERFEEDSQRALEILEELSAQDPDNGVYDYYSAPVLKDLGAGDAAVKARFLRAFQKPRYDIADFRIGQRLYQKSFANSAYFAAGQNARYFLPNPSPWKAASVIRDFLRKQDDPQFNLAVRKFSQRMIDQNQPTKPEYESIDWSWVDASIASNHQIKSWNPKDGPNPYNREQFRRVFLPPLTTNEAPIQNIDKWVNENPCNADAIDNYVKIQKENYLNYKEGK